MYRTRTVRYGNVSQEETLCAVVATQRAIATASSDGVWSGKGNNAARALRARRWPDPMLGWLICEKCLKRMNGVNAGG